MTRITRRDFGLLTAGTFLAGKIHIAVHARVGTLNDPLLPYMGRSVLVTLQP